MDRFLFSTDTDAGTVSVLRLEEGNVTNIKSIPVGSGPRGGVKFTSEGIGYVANHAGNTVSIIDGREFSEIGRIAVGVAPIGVGIVGDKFLIVANGGEDSISVVDIYSKSEIYKIATGRDPRHPSVAPDGTFGYVPIAGSHAVVRLDLKSLIEGDVDNRVTEVSRINLEFGTFPYTATIAPNGQMAVVANNQASYISIIDAAKDAEIERIDVGGKGARGTAFTPEGDLAFVSIENANEIAVIDLNNFLVIDRLPAGPGPRGVLFDSSSKQLFSAAFDRGGPSFLPRLAGNAISVIPIGEERDKLAALVQRSGYSVPVGAGPCSVTMLAR